MRIGQTADRWNLPRLRSRVAGDVFLVASALARFDLCHAPLRVVICVALFAASTIVLREASHGGAARLDKFAALSEPPAH